MSLRKIISGGQSGVDQAALSAAVELKLETGGMMPKGYLTEEGPRPRFARLYGVQEDSSEKYPPRTKWNVEHSTATLLFGEMISPGCTLTIKCCAVARKNFHITEWWSRFDQRDLQIRVFQRWLSQHNVEVLNVAGNRESSQPGIYRACYDFLIDALS